MKTFSPRTAMPHFQTPVLRAALVALAASALAAGCAGTRKVVEPTGPVQQVEVSAEQYQYEGVTALAAKDLALAREKLAQAV